MNQEYFEQLSDMAKKVQEPFQALAELNVKTLQGLSYIKPEDLANIKKPEELLESQVKLAIANGQKSLEYLEKSFRIIEKAMLTYAQDAKKARGDKK